MKLLAIIIIMSFILMGTVSASETLILQDPDTEILEDTFVTEDQPTTNKGSADPLWVDNIGTQRWAWLKFNLSDLPTSIDILSATLTITGAGVAYDGDYECFNATNLTWSEDIITWNNQPNTSIADSLGNDSTSFTPIEFNVGGAVNSSYNAGNTNITFFINASIDDNTTEAAFYSKEQATASNRPKLTITYQLQSKPRWYTNQSSIPSEYNPNSTQRFNITWNTTDTTLANISWVYIETNLTGTATNYTATNTTYGNDIYNVTIDQSFEPAHYYWRSYANDTLNNYWNLSDIWYFTISKNATNPITINASVESLDTLNNDFIVDTTQYVTVTVTPTYTSSGTAQLWVDGLNYPNPDIRSWGAATYTIKGNISGNANYSTNSTGLNVTMTAYVPTIGGGGTGGGSGGGSSLAYIYINESGFYVLNPLSEQPGIKLETWFFTSKVISFFTPFHLMLFAMMMFIPVYRRFKHRPLTSNDPVLFILMVIIVLMVVLVSSPEMLANAQISTQPVGSLAERFESFRLW